MSNMYLAGKPYDSHIHTVRIDYMICVSNAIEIVDYHDIDKRLCKMSYNFGVACSNQTNAMGTQLYITVEVCCNCCYYLRR